MLETAVLKTRFKFAMVSEWMPNGNINQFVEAHRDANRFELVSFPSRFLSFSLIANDCVAGRCREGLDPCARAGNGSWGPQGGTFSRPRVTLNA